MDLNTALSNLKSAGNALTGADTTLQQKRDTEAAITKELQDAQAATATALSDDDAAVQQWNQALDDVIASANASKRTPSTNVQS